jgi:FkbM family methyltransferase
MGPTVRCQPESDRAPPHDTSSEEGLSMGSNHLPWPTATLKEVATAGVRRAAAGDAGRLVEWTARSVGRAFPGARAARWFCFHAGEALRERFPDAERVATLPCGARMILPLADYNGRHLYFHGIYEPHVTALVPRLLEPGETALDVGANNGFYTALFARRAGSKGSVHAFECNPGLIHRIARMIVLNDFDRTVRLNPVAISDREGAARFYVGDHLGTTGLSSLVRKTYLAEERAIGVTTTTLDAYTREKGLGEIALLKMDIESAEMAALRGAAWTLATRPPRAILCEVADNRHSLATDGVEFAPGTELIRTLADYDYAPFRVVPGGLVPYRGEPVAHEEFCFIHRPVLRRYAGLRCD